MVARNCPLVDTLDTLVRFSYMYFRITIATSALVLLLKWPAAVDRDPTLLFVNERGFIEEGFVFPVQSQNSTLKTYVIQNS